MLRSKIVTRKTKMIVIIHILAFIYARSGKRMKNEHLWRNNKWFNGGSYYFFSDGKKQLKFDPPCYIQRYATVAGLIREELAGTSGKKVVEFGCAELNFFRELKNIKAVAEVVEVDIDEDLLIDCRQRVEPLLIEHVRKRESPFSVKVMAGSVDQFDSCLENANVVVAIELIEHLHLEVLAGVPEIIFGNIRPDLAIITTPNADFNTAIPDLSGMRHYDHKFEWSREEFTQWAVGVTEAFSDYTVLFYGIGRGPDGTEHLGRCSQMAVFRLKTDSQLKPLQTPVSNYKLVKEYVYPVDTTTTEEKIMAEVNCRLQYLECQEDYGKEILLEKFLVYLEGLCQDVQSLRKVLESFGRKVYGTNNRPFLLTDRGYDSEDSGNSDDCDNEIIENFENTQETDWITHDSYDDNWD